MKTISFILPFQKIVRRMISVFLLVTLIGSLSACAFKGSETSETETQNLTVLRVGMECAYAPNNWEEESASNTNLPISNKKGFYAEGYDVQIAKLVCNALDADIEIVKLSWDGLLEALNNGQSIWLSLVW